MDLEEKQNSLVEEKENRMKIELDNNNGDGAIYFPKDRIEIIKSSIENIIRAIGDNPEREGLRKTPERYAKALVEVLSGYFQSPEEIINGAIFEQDYSGMVIVKNIRFFSMCEHHILPFFGICSAAYFPQGKIIGLSKIPRIVRFFASRLQVQERMTEQIGKFIEEAINPEGVAVYISAHHLCLAMRGAKKEDVKMETLYFSGKFEKDFELKKIFLRQVKDVDRNNINSI
jgi:GTP cyclohydrolase I (EC 3.5.4.16)